MRFMSGVTLRCSPVMSDHVHKCEPDELMRPTREVQVGKGHKLDLLKQIWRAGTEVIGVPSWGHLC